MLDDIAGAYGSRFFLAAGGVGIALLCLVGVLWFLRHRAPSPFVRGGRSRQPRLQVLDAAAVDARRRLVLVRRDGVEHLIMIGGPTDIVIESGIVDATAPLGVPAPAAAFEAVTAEPGQAAPRQERAAAVSRQPQRPAGQTSAEINPPAPPIAASGPRAVERPQPVRERVPTERPAVVEAADILDAARQRVLPQTERQAPAQPAQSFTAASPEGPVAARPAAIVPPVAAAAPAPRPREPGGDFQRVLDTEMSNNLAAERIVGQTPSPPRSPQPAPSPRREPELTPVAGADAALQQEVARIFGEMSVSREK